MDALFDADRVEARRLIAEAKATAHQIKVRTDAARRRPRPLTDKERLTLLEMENAELRRSLIEGAS